MNTLAIVDLILLGLLMLGLGCSIDYEQFKQKFRKPIGISIGLFSQFIAMPAVTFGIAKWLLDGEPLLQVALVLIGCCPGGALSNILSFFFGADLPLSLAMTTASSVLAIGMLPLNIYLYITLTGLGSAIKIDFAGIIMSVAVIIVGTFVGIFVRSKSTTWAVRCGKIGGFAGVLLVLIGFVANAKSQTPIWAQDTKTYMAAFLTTLIGLIVGLTFSLLARLQKPSCVAISIETSIQNKIIAIAIIGISFPTQADKDVANSIPLVYSLFATIINVIWALVAWKIGFTTNDSKVSLWELLTNAKSEPSISTGANGEPSNEAISDAPSANNTELEELEAGQKQFEKDSNTDRESESGMCASPLHKHGPPGRA